MPSLGATTSGSEALALASQAVSDPSTGVSLVT